MQESKKSPPKDLDSSEWYENALNDQIIKNEHQVLEEKILALEKKVEELSQRPIAKVMYKPPGATKHMELAHYLNEVETRLNTLDLRIELDV
tara:strand:+ start:423 stop:698 length:276 start_codon:yes stop_codon:yes gene_type:complete